MLTVTQSQRGNMALYALQGWR